MKPTFKKGDIVTYVGKDEAANTKFVGLVGEVIRQSVEFVEIDLWLIGKPIENFMSGAPFYAYPQNLAKIGE